MDDLMKNAQILSALKSLEKTIFIIVMSHHIEKTEGMIEAVKFIRNEMEIGLHESVEQLNKWRINFK